MMAMNRPLKCKVIDYLNDSKKLESIDTNTEHNTDTHIDTRNSFKKMKVN